MLHNHVFILFSCIHKLYCLRLRYIGWFEVDPVIFGLALSLLIQLGSIFQWYVILLESSNTYDLFSYKQTLNHRTIRQSAEVTNQMVCVERVSEYSELVSEAALVTDKDSDDLLASWPTNGAIEVRDLSVRYRTSLPLSLNKVNFSLPCGKSLGIVGRTGSGK